MKPFLLTFAMATVCFFLSSSMTPRYRAANAPQKSPSAFEVHFYWYLDEDDSYDSWSTVGDEMYRLQNIYGGVVNSSPYGTAILVAKGYATNAYPHTLPAIYFLYWHY